MPRLLQALFRLATLRWLGVSLCALATLLATANTASALEPTQTKTRVWGFELGGDNSVGLFRAASSGKHRGNCSARSEAASGSLLAARGGGKAFTGTAYELKHIAKHLEGTAQANRLIRGEGAAHVFTDKATLEAVENAIFEGGQFTGVVRGYERFGLMFESPIGARIAADGTRKPLFYGEAKVGADGLYHVFPRTGPSLP